MTAPILLKDVSIVPAKPNAQGQVADILLENGRIAQIATAITPEEGWQVVAQDGLHVSVGWFDLGAALNEPGYEHKEELGKLCAADSAGGFTDVATLPNTLPVVQSKESIRYVKSQQLAYPTRLHPIAALTVDTAGAQMTEMVDLHHAGAVAFSDGHHVRYGTTLFKTCLEYLQACNGLLMATPTESALSDGGQMHEGPASTRLGMKGIPALAEEMAVARYLALLGYTGGRLHLSQVSTPKSIALIREAKKEGLQVTCDIAAHHLAFTDEDLHTFNTFLKVFPPFRNRASIDAMLAGLADGTIDAVVSAHCPQDHESKALEFDLADFGAIGLETAFAALHTHTKLSLHQKIALLTEGPRRVLGMPVPKVAVGEPACLTLFLPNCKWTPQPKQWASQGNNSPFIGHLLKGKPVGIIRGEWAVIGPLA